MSKLIYAATLSLDGYIEAARGEPDWMFPDEELHRHFNRLEAEIDTHLYGRRMYEDMAAFWPTADQDPEAPAYVREYAQIWRAAEKVVFSSSLAEVKHNARLVRTSARAEVQRLKQAVGRSLSVGGLELASDLAGAGLIDEYLFYYAPVLLGAGRAAFSQLKQRVALRVVETRPFASGTVLLRCVPEAAPGTGRAGQAE